MYFVKKIKIFLFLEYISINLSLKRFYYLGRGCLRLLTLNLLHAVLYVVQLYSFVHCKYMLETALLYFMENEIFRASSQ
jgi:hypothetical protein